MKNPVYYIIGDIHGEVDLLKYLHNDIYQYHSQRFRNYKQTLIHLGDYVDRGYDSFSVIEYLMTISKSSPRNTRIISLKGNHEEMMVQSCRAPHLPKLNHWLNNGGQHTLDSYRRSGFSMPPKSHLDWIAGLPSYYHDKENKLICVHAGVNIDNFPQDGEAHHLWTRSSKFFDTSNWNNPELEGMTLVHGHTPTEGFIPEISDNRQRINIDTGACYGGFLTAAIIRNGQLIDFLST